MTHVAIVCNDTSLQPALPQILLVAEKILSKVSAEYVEPMLPSNIHLWRRKSGWVNIPAFLEIIEVLANVLDKHASGRPRILLMDALKMRLSDESLNTDNIRKFDKATMIKLHEFTQANYKKNNGTFIRN